MNRPQVLAQTMELPVTVLRPSVAYGPGQREDMFLPALICALLRGEPFPMTAGEQTRDFIYISDLVEALGLAGLDDATNGEVINIGGGSAIRITDLVDKVELMTQSHGMARRGAVDYRPGEAMRYLLDISKSARLLGWYPSTPLEQGLQQTVDWYRAHSR